MIYTIYHYHNTIMATIQAQPMPYANPNQITDMLMSNLLISKLGNVMESEFELTGPNILKILLLLSAGEIKNGVNAMVVSFINYVKDMPNIILGLVMSLVGFMKKKKPLKIENNVCDNYVPENLISIEVESNFLILMCNYMIKSDNCLYKLSATDAIIKNTKETCMNIKFNNVIIKFNDYNLELSEQITCQKDIYKNEIIGAVSGMTKPAMITDYLDFLSGGQKDIVEKIYMLMDKKAKENGLTLIDSIKSKISFKVYEKENCFSEMTITNLIIGKYPNLNKDDTFIKILIIGTLLYAYCGYACITQGISSLRNGKMIFDKNNIYPSNTVNDGTGETTGINYYYPIIVEYTNELKLNENVNIKEQFKPFLIQSETKKISSNHVLTFTISNSQIDTQHAITEFITTVQNSYKKNTTKTKISSVILAEDKKTSEIPNPEYDEYETKKKMLESMKVDTNPSNLLIYEFLNKPIPPKTILKETVTKRIECKFLNEKEKDFETLFLRKNDKDELTNSLDMFKNKGDAIRGFGLQNKYNLLLYGKPGTGKTTTIEAVANYLKKDIYYINLLNVDTNEDLHMIFEYVNKNIPNSGIIIMEDIDAMTNVVLKRTDELCEYKVNDIINNQKSKLTLEYFLNILQGTLTIDDSIFIVTTNHIEHLDPAFYRDGRFDVKIELKLCDKFQIGSIYQKMMGDPLPNNILDKVIEDTFSPATIIYHIKKYVFCANIDPEEIMKPFI
jgi:ATP-dependent 26S proteasome regulatory subunit